MALATASGSILELLAAEYRHVLSQWRAVILMRRATFAIAPQDRRWSRLPQYPEDMVTYLRQMRARQELRAIPGHPRLNEVVVPYARKGFLDEREVLFEAHPYAVLSHISALAFHGLTTDQPKGLTITVSADTTGGILPIGTTPRDWEGVTMPSATTPSRVLGRPVHAKRVKPALFFGFAEYEPLGFPMRYTALERTLIDGLMAPDLCGGIDAVLRAWGLGQGLLDLDVLIHQVERIGVALLRQRVGFVLTELGLTHPRLDAWRRTARRGGSSRLAGSEPFASTYDERWNLSINVPVDALHAAAT